LTYTERSEKNTKFGRMCINAEETGLSTLQTSKNVLAKGGMKEVRRMTSEESEKM
jgi:hypothetical protein